MTTFGIERAKLARMILAMLAADHKSSFEDHIDILQLAIDFRKIDVAHKRERDRRKQRSA